MRRRSGSNSAISGFSANFAKTSGQTKHGTSVAIRQMHIEPFLAVRFGSVVLRMANRASAALRQPLNLECHVKNLLNRLMQEEAGQDVIEYALLAAGISIVIIPIAPRIGALLETSYGNIETAVTAINQ